MKKRVMLIFVLFLVLTMPLAHAQVTLGRVDLSGQVAAIEDDIRTDLSGIETIEDIVGEDILINVAEYQPRVIKTNLIEDRGLNVYALLEGSPTNPTLTIPRIRRISFLNTRVTTLPEGKPIPIPGLRFVPPENYAYSYDNMGYVVIPIRRIPREQDVPDEIFIETRARIYFDVSEGLTFGPTDDVLLEQSKEDWLLEKEDHSFFGGYLRASEINSEDASFVLYDENLNEYSRPIKVAKGATSRTLSTSQTFASRYARLFDKFRIRVNDIRGPGRRAVILVNRNGELSKRVLAQGDSLYPGSLYSVRKIEGSPTQGNYIITLSTKQGEKKEVKLYGTIRQTTGNTTTTTTATTTDPQQVKLRDIQNRFRTAPTVNRNKDYDAVLVEIRKFMDGQELKSEIKRELRTVLVSILATYDAQIQEVDELFKTVTSGEPRLNLENKRDQLVEKRQTVIDLINTASTSLPSETRLEQQADLNSLRKYQEAIQQFRKIVSLYPEQRDATTNELQAANAQYQIAFIYDYHVKDKEQAIAEYETLLSTYKPEDIAQINGVGSMFAIRNRISQLNNLQTSLDQAAQDLEDQDGELVRVTLLDVREVNLKFEQYAEIEVNGVTKQYRQGEILENLPVPVAGEQNLHSYEVQTIREDDVTLLRRARGVQGQTTAGTINLKLGTTARKLTSFPGVATITDASGKQISAPSDFTVRLVSVSTQNEAYITIIPEPERAFSETNFNLRLPIEKRALAPELFSDNIDAAIQDTESLLQDLEKIIINVEKIHNYWKQFCFITYGVIWAKNFLSGVFGGEGAVARKKVGEQYKERYRQGEFKDCSDQRLSYEECIFEHQEEFERDVEIAEQAVDQIQNDAHKSLYPNLGKEYEEDKKDLYYAQAMYKANPTQRNAEAYYNLNAQLTKTNLNSGFTQEFFDNNLPKNYAELEPERAREVKELALTSPSLKKTLESEEYKNDFGKFYDNYIVPGTNNNNRLIADYRNRHVNKQLETHFNEIESGVTGDDKKYVQAVRNTYFRRDPYRTKVLFNSIQQDPSGKYYYFLGNERQDLEAEQYKTIQEGIEQNGQAHVNGYVFTNKFDSKVLHDPSLSIVKQGSSKGKIQSLSLDAYHYVDVTYSTSGIAQKYELFERPEENGPLGTGVRVGEVDNLLLDYYQKKDPTLHKKLTESRKCVTKMNKKITRKKRGDVAGTCSELGNYPYKVTDSIEGVGKSCVDFMSPTDCRLLFNACDPVICPASRCNFGGEWEVDNVVETGIIGSSFLCIKNFPTVVMPICITGIVAGLHNIRSILEGYNQCLKVSKVQGRSVGICDRIRSFGICEMLWREAIAIFNVKGGIFGTVIRSITGDDEEGGTEYSAFDQSYDNAIGSLQFFTGTYAKNTFAQFNGGTLPEIGAEVCRSAIYGKVPGIGSFYDRVLRPESPPQFTAFFDEALLSDIPTQPRSQYEVFYHIYAGENQDVTFSVFLQQREYTGEIVATLPLVRSRRLHRGQFASENPDFVARSNFNEICVEVVSEVYGRNFKCGPGKVSTDFALNFLTDQFTQSELLKNVNTAEECVPQTGRLTTLSPQNQAFTSGQLGRAALGSVSTGFLNTGLVRRCSLFDPSVGTGKQDWSPVGHCGKDDQGRELGTCWAYIPAAQRVVQNLDDRRNIQTVLEEKAREVTSEIKEEGLDLREFNILEDGTIEELFRQATVASTQAQGATPDDSLALYQEAERRYIEIINSKFISDEHAVRSYNGLGNLYKSWGDSLRIAELTKLVPAVPTTATKITTPAASTSACEIDKVYFAQDAEGRSNFRDLTVLRPEYRAGVLNNYNIVLNIVSGSPSPPRVIPKENLYAVASTNSQCVTIKLALVHQNNYAQTPLGIFRYIIEEGTAIRVTPLLLPGTAQQANRYSIPITLPLSTAQAMLSAPVIGSGDKYKIYAFEDANNDNKINAGEVRATSLDFDFQIRNY